MMLKPLPARPLWSRINTIVIQRAQRGWMIEVQYYVPTRVQSSDVLATIGCGRRWLIPALWATWRLVCSEDHVNRCLHGPFGAQT